MQAIRNELARILQVDESDIDAIRVMKSGMTNQSFLANYGENQYIVRIPGKGTEQLINRGQEATVYRVIEPLCLSEEVIWMDAESGLKISKFLQGAHVCNAYDETEVRNCIRQLKKFHTANLKVEHTFDLFEQILFYEAQRGDMPSAYSDYQETKQQILSLKEYVTRHAGEMCLTHIDAVPDNFLILEDGSVRMIDWEYAGMQDPHVDLAMFCIYAMYNRQQVDRLIDVYFDGECEWEVRVKIYCYIAIGGLLWSNWCEYKHSLGICFGDYAKRQYQYAKEYYRIFLEENNVSD